MRKKKRVYNKSTGRDYTYDKEYQATPSRKKYRAELNREAKKRGIYGKRWNKGVDLSHKKDGGMELENRSQNRARKGRK